MNKCCALVGVIKS